MIEFADVDKLIVLVVTIACVYLVCCVCGVLVCWLKDCIRKICKCVFCFCNSQDRRKKKALPDTCQA